MILISSIAALASAATLEYVDYITNLDYYPAGTSDKYPNGYYLVTVSFPLDSFKIYAMSNGSIVKSTTTTSLSYNFLSNTNYQVFFALRNGLSVTDIPDGTEFEAHIDVDYAGFTWPSNPEPNIRLFLNYYNSEGVLLKQQYSPSEAWPDPEVAGPFYTWETMNKPVGSDYVMPSVQLSSFRINGASGASYACTFRLLSCSFIMTLDSLILQQAQTGKTNKILESVEKKLEEQNQTLEDLLQGTPEQNQAAGEAVDSLRGSGDKLNDLNDSLNSVEKPDTSDIKVSVGDIISTSSLTSLTAPILAFWENEVLRNMLIIVLTLVLVSWVFFGKKG